MYKKLKARFAGSFYEKNKEKLIKQIEECINHKFGPGKKELKINGRAVIVGHAGYAFSGPSMAYCYAALKENERIFIFATNHRGKGNKDLIVLPKAVRSIEIPNGNISIDRDAWEKFRLILSEYVEENEEIFKNEHSWEVQLPFIKYFFPKSKILPVIVNTYDKDKLYYFAEKTLEIDKSLGKNSCFVFTSDFTHYGIAYGFVPYDVSGKSLKEKIYLYDKQCIDKIISLDVEGFENEARKTTVCGVAPIMLAINLAKIEKLSPMLLSYYTSSDIINDYDYVSHAIVGYAGIVFR